MGLVFPAKFAVQAGGKFFEYDARFPDERIDRAPAPGKGSFEERREGIEG